MGNQSPRSLAQSPPRTRGHLHMHLRVPLQNPARCPPSCLQLRPLSAKGHPAGAGRSPQTLIFSWTMKLGSAPSTPWSAESNSPLTLRAPRTPSACTASFQPLCTWQCLWRGLPLACPRNATCARPPAFSSPFVPKMGSPLSQGKPPSHKEAHLHLHSPADPPSRPSNTDPSPPQGQRPAPWQSEMLKWGAKLALAQGRQQ